MSDTRDVGTPAASMLSTAYAGLGSQTTTPFTVGSESSPSVDSRYVVFGFQSGQPRVFTATPPRRTYGSALQRLRGVLADMPDQLTEVGAVEELAAEIADLAGERGRANVLLLGDDA